MAPHPDPLAVVTRSFAAIDAGDVAAAVATHMSEGCRFQFANAPAVFGHAPIVEAIGHITARVERLDHRIESAWVVDGERPDVAIVICELVVSYAMPSGVTLACPGCVVIHVDGDGRIVDQRNYGDLGPVFAGGAS
jgi:ketosteroid isomerase-like protein